MSHGPPGLCRCRARARAGKWDVTTRGSWAPGRDAAETPMIRHPTTDRRIGNSVEPMTSEAGRQHARMNDVCTAVLC
eukprot:1820674-Prymnesium_polylepis.1